MSQEVTAIKVEWGGIDQYNTFMEDFYQRGRIVVYNFEGIRIINYNKISESDKISVFVICLLYIGYLTEIYLNFNERLNK